MNKSGIIMGIALLIVFSWFYLNTGGDTAITGSSISEYADSPEELIIVPVKVHVIKEPSGYYTSARGKENIIITIDQANRIWSQAGIYFRVDDIIISDLTAESVPNAINGNNIGLFDAEGFDQKKINVFFTKSLNGINGLALTNINSVLISDFTTVADYRTTAHELGHLLGLKHVDSADKLMARGKNGETLDLWEIEISRNRASTLSALTE